MKALITGGSGFIGAEVARLVAQRADAKPVLFDLHPSPERLGDLAERVEVVRGNLGTFAHVLEAVRRAAPTVIFHLGGMLSLPSEEDPAGALRANALGTYHVLEAARLFGVPQVLFTSSVGTYGLDLRERVLRDDTLQRPVNFYGATKVFGEHMGRFYRRTYGLDFRGVRYPSIVGPGVRTPGAVQYTSWMIEESAQGRPFRAWARPDTRAPVLYYKDAARALVELQQAPAESIRTVVYLVAGPSPDPSAQELADAVARAARDQPLQAAGPGVRKGKGRPSGVASSPAEQPFSK